MADYGNTLMIATKKKLKELMAPIKQRGEASGNRNQTKLLNKIKEEATGGAKAKAIPLRQAPKDAPLTDAKIKRNLKLMGVRR